MVHRGICLSLLLSAIVVLSVAHGVEVSFNAGKGSGTAAITSYYHSGIGSEISEVARTRTGLSGIQIADARSADVSGDFSAGQVYSSSSGLSGAAYVQASGASGTAGGWYVTGSDGLLAVQNASLSGREQEAGMRVEHGMERSFAGVISNASSGRLASCQIISGDSCMSAHQSSTIDAEDGQGLIRAFSNFKGWDGIKTWEIWRDEDYRKLPDASRPWTEPSASDTRAQSRNGLIRGVQYAVVDGGAATSGSVHMDLGEEGLGTVESSSSNSLPGLENMCYVFGGNASYLASKISGTMDASTYAWANRSRADAGGWSASGEKAVIFEPVYMRFSAKMTTPPSGHPDFGTEGDTARYYFSRAGYQVWRYTDAAATRDRLYTIDGYDVSMISSHMTPESIVLNTFTYDSDLGIPVEDEAAAGEIGAAYQEPHQGSLVIFDGCFSSGPQPGTSPLFNAVGKAVQRGGAIAGYERMVDVGWSVDSMGLITEDLYGGMTIGEANSHAMKVYAPWWESLDPKRKGKSQTLIIAGNQSLKIR